MQKIILTTLMISISTFVSAAYKDVIKMKLIEGCSAEEIVELKEEFMKVMKEKNYDYSAEVWTPVFSNETSGYVYWVGTAPDLADFGPEFTRYFNEVSKGNTQESKIEAGFDECRVEISRSGFLTQ